MILVVTVLTGCGMFPSVPILDTNTSEPTTTTDTDSTAETNETTIPETNSTTDTSQETTENSEPVPISSDSTDIENVIVAENEDELIGHWEFVEKVIIEPTNYVSETSTIDYFVFNNAATCDSMAIQTATGKKEIENISSKVQWSDPDYFYLPDDIIYLQLAAEIVNFDRPPGGTNFSGVSIWAYTAGVNASSLSPSSSNMQTADMKKLAKASVVNGEITVKSEDIEVSGTLGPGSDGSQRAIYIRSLLHKGGHATAKYIYEYKTSALPEYDSVEPQDENANPPEAVVEIIKAGHWELKSKTPILLTESPLINQLALPDSLGTAEDSSKYFSTSIIKTLATSDGGKFYAAQCLWTEPKAMYLPDESISIKLIANYKGNDGAPIDELLNKFDTESFYDLVNIWAIIDSEESGYTAAFCSDEITLFSRTETNVSGALGSGEEGDLKTIGIRYAFPEIGGIDYNYEYVLD
jgi:hypothetical protein